ncbi:MAG: TatD family hydrolase, partial [Candidatus Limisoma sp.]
ILLETDCPYLTPVPYRGRRNESAYIPYIAAKIADVLGTSVDDVSARTDANAARFFDIAV